MAYTKQRYTYQDAGFNGFLTRALNSNPNAQSLSDQPSGGSNTMSFDRLQVEGSVGDKMTWGRLVADGQAGRFIVKDKTNTDEQGWIGDLTD